MRGSAWVLAALAAGAVDANQELFRVGELPFTPGANVSAIPPMYAGLLPIDRVHDATRDAHLFFWLVDLPEDSDVDPNSAPLVLWTNGGPGCSSLLGMMNEMGPFFLKRDDFLPEINEFAWNGVGPTLYIEHPVGAGFTFLDGKRERFVLNEHQMATDLYGFLQTFLAIFERFQGRDMYFFGESYAGKYVPAAAYEILVRNKARRANSDLFHLPLKGIGIGNGWMEPFAQTRAYADFLYGNGLIDRQAARQMRELIEACLSAAKNRDTIVREDFDVCDIMNIGMRAAGMPNQYDTRLYDLPIDAYYAEDAPDAVMVRFLLDPQTLAAVHVRGPILRSAKRLDALREALAHPGGEGWEAHDTDIWNLCNLDVNSAMDHDVPYESVTQLKYILENPDPVSGPVRALIYSGSRDLNCNTLGTQVLLDEMEWVHQKAWLAEKRSLWVLGDPKSDAYSVSGYTKEVENLYFVIVVNSGHLMPMDVPPQAFDMLKRFVNNQSYRDLPLVYPMDGVPDALETLRPDGLRREDGWLYWAPVGAFAIGIFAGLLGAYGHGRLGRRRGYEVI